MIRSLPPAVCLLVVALVSPCVAQPPAVSVAVPAAIAPGKPTDVTFYGANLAGAVGAWTSFGATVELTPGIDGNGTKADQVTYRLTVPEAASLQTGGARIATGAGISNIRLVMIDDLPTIGDNGANKTIETAQELTLPVAVDGAAEGESYDFYKFTATAGQRVSIEVFARRLGYPLDPVIRLLDSQGRELAYSDDEGGIGADCRFVHQFDADGVYLIEIRDIRYQGGGTHRYRMRIGDFPLVTTPMPLSAHQGSTVKLTAAGPQVARAAVTNAAVPATATESLAVTFKNADGRGSAFGQLEPSASRELVEFEPNNAPEQATPVVLPAAISGRFAAAKDKDFYQFDVAAGQRFVFVGKTRQLGSPTDLYLRLYKADGALLAEADDNGTDEGSINFAFAEAGTYRLMVEDLHRRGGPEQTYLVDVVPYQPGFALALEADKFDVPRGGVFVAKVTSRRFDYNGPITLAIEGVDGLTLANNVIAEGQNEVVLQATAPAALEPGQWRNIGVVGRAKIGETEVVRRAETSAALKGQFSGLPFPPKTLDGIVGLGVGPVFADFFKLAVDAVRFPQLVGQAVFTVKAEKLNGFTDTIALAVDGLPPEFTAEVKPIEKDKAETQIVLKGPLAATEAEYRFRIVGSANFQNQPKSVVVDQVTLKVTPPIALALEAPAPVKAGEKIKLKARATRDSGDKAPIALAFHGLPLGVTAPEGAAIVEGQNEVEIELATAPNSMVGAANVSVTGTTIVSGKEVRAQSAPIALEVAMP